MSMNIDEVETNISMKEYDDMDQETNERIADYPCQEKSEFDDIDSEKQHSEYNKRTKNYAEIEIDLCESNRTNALEYLSTNNVQHRKRHQMSGREFVHTGCTLQSILQEIGLFNELYDYLKSSDLDCESLTYMSDKHFDELFKNTNLLRLKIIFEHRLKKWQEKHKQYYEDSTSLQISQKSCKSNDDCLVLAIKDTEGTSSTFHFPKTNTPTQLPNRLMEVIENSLETVLEEYRQGSKHKKEGTEECERDLKKRRNSDTQEESFVKIELVGAPSESGSQKSIDTPTKNEVDLSDLSKAREIKPSNQIVNSQRLEPSEMYNRKRKWGLETVVREILLMYKSGNLLLELYQGFGAMTPEMRTELVHLLVDHFVINHANLAVPQCRQLAEEIVELFPTECLDTYFFKETRICTPKGKLWDRYTNQRQRYKKLLKSLQNPPNPVYPRQDGTEMELLCSKLKSIEDEKRLLRKWNKTFNFRRYQLQSQQFASWKLYFDEYPFCKQPNYSQYIDADLAVLYPNLKFDENLWDNFINNFKVIYWNRIRHGKSRELFDELISTDIPGKSDFYEIKITELLHAVLNSSKDVIEEAQRQFAVEVADLGELKKLVIERKKFCFDNDIQCNPYIAVVGKDRCYDHYSVVLDSTGFSCDSYQESVILCFKLYLFFDLCYSEETFNTWIFIQKYFFNKHSILQNDVVDTFILDVISQKNFKLK